MSAPAISRADLESYAAIIGISLPQEEYLMMPLAVEGISAPLPPGWEMHYTDDNKQYFHNSVENKTIWDHPEDERYKRLVVEKRKHVAQCAKDLGQKGTTNPALLAIAAEMAFAQLPDGWVAHQDADGNTYYQNTQAPPDAADAVTWKHPLAAAFLPKIMQQQQPGGTEPLAGQREQQQPRNLQPSALAAAAPAAVAPSSSGNVPVSSNVGYHQEVVAHNMRSDLRSPASPGTEMQVSTTAPAAAAAVAGAVHHERPSVTTTTTAPADTSTRSQLCDKQNNTDGLRLEYHPVLGAPFKKGTQYNPATYDSEWGPPFPPKFHERPEIKNRLKYDDWFGAPIKPGAYKRPQGPPKMSFGSSGAMAAGGAQRQQQPQVMQHQHQQRQQQIPQPSVAAGVPPSAVAAAGSPVQQQQQQQQHHQQHHQQQQQQQQMQVFAFAQYLGVDPQKEPALLPIVAAALRTPPPEPWRATVDPQSGRTYYGNPQTKETSWDHPLKAQFLQTIQQARGGQQQPHQQQHPASPVAAPAAAAPIHAASSPSSPNQQASAAVVLTSLSPEERQRLDQYAQYLSEGGEAVVAINLDREPYLVDILREGVEAPLPAGWEEHDQDGKAYYYNQATEKSSWSHPADEVFKTKVAEARMRQQQQQGREQQAMARGAPVT